MSKRIVVCCDGTWNNPDQEDGDVHAPTNVFKLYKRILPEAADGTTQVKYYREGVGNEGFFDRWIGGGFGRGLDEVLTDAYRFVVANYVPGDELYLFGFSRGAYTVRSLAGLIHNCGVLRIDAPARVADAIKLYRSRSSAKHPKGAISQRFRKDHSHEPRIRFLGVWDTVGALGIPGALGRATPSGRYAFHDTQLSSQVDHAYHALAIDERRKAFRPTLWTTKIQPGQVVEQVWFCGAHADVGGGYADPRLANVPCLWMAGKAVAAGLAIEMELLQKEMECDPCAPIHEPHKGKFRIMGIYPRPIGAGLPASAESVHESVYLRLRRDPPVQPPYRPENLDAFERVVRG